MLAPALAACRIPFRDVPRDTPVDTPDYASGPARTGSLAGAALPQLDGTAPARVWRAKVGRGTLGTPAVGDRVIVIANVDRWLYAVDARNGKLYWRWRAESPFTTGAIAGRGSIYAGTEGRNGQVVAVSVDRGKRRWTQRVGSVGSHLTLADSSIYGVTETGNAFALRADDGRVRWSRPVGGSRTGPLVADGRVTMVTIADSLMVLDAATGAVRRRVLLPVGAAAPLARLDSTTAIVASPVGALLAVDLETGVVRWRIATGAPVHGVPVVVGDTVLALTVGCTLWAVPAREPSRADSATIRIDSLPLVPLVASRGDSTSTAAAGSIPGTRRSCVTVAGPAAVRGGVLVATVGGDILFYDRGARHTRWVRRVGGELRHPPSIDHGQIVVAPIVGDVVTFR